MTTILRCDVAIIGAGTAGIAAERAAREAGASTRLIDEHFAGTTCASVGCMPSKLLIAAATAVHAVGQASLFGIRTTQAEVDGRAVMQRVQRERDAYVASVQETLSKLPPDVRLRARARFRAPDLLELSDGRQLKSRAFVIATGSKSQVPEFLSGVRDRVLTNDNVFDLHDLPGSIAVIGAGPLGLELAQAFHRLGVVTEVFDEKSTLTGIADPMAESACRDFLGKELPLCLGVKLGATTDTHGVRLTWSGARSGSKVFERVLAASGRPPALSDLHLEATGVKLDAHGVPEHHHESLQCGDSALFIAGDASRDRPVLHEAAAEGVIAGRNAASYPVVKRVNRFASLSVMFTDPQVAIAGEIPTPDAVGIVRGSASYADQGRAKIYARNEGLINLYADDQLGLLKGATLVGPAVEHSGHLMAWAIQKGLTAHEVLSLPLYHPTYEEGLKPALREICKKVHTTLDDASAVGE